MADFETMAALVATREAELASAREALSACREVRAGIEARVSEKQVQVADLRTRLSAGKLTDSEAGGLATLFQADLEDLGALISESDREVAKAQEGVDRCESALRSAEQALDGALAQAEFRAFHDHCRLLEKTYLDALHELSGLARRAGVGNAGVLHTFFSVSPHVQRVTQGVVPPGGA